ncbi:MAG: hypothetical protein RIQ59_1861, partial [Bacteroidota bacterium]
YDKNGNIMTLKRNGDNDVQTGTIGIDNLSYGYATTSNKLMSVVDNSNNTSGFNDYNKVGDDYSYDANGNLITDKNKKITSIVYNHLNLPTKIIFATGNIVYIYNAAGQKVQKVVTTTTPASVVTTDYLGGYQYKNTVLQYFPTAEGYVKNTANVFSYVFNYTDHLGNVRLSYTKDATTGSLKILEESNYYPFGLMHKGYNNLVSTNNPAEKLLFNGKELQDELNLNEYDFGARMYDPSYVRTLTQDPLAEKFYSYSSYSFLNNNPISYIDPSGMEAYKSQVDRSSEMSNSEWNSNRRADMDRQAGGDGMDIANPDGYVKKRSTATASDAQEEGAADEDGNPTDPPKKKGKSKSSGIENQTKMNFEIVNLYLSIAEFIAELQTWAVGGKLIEGASVVSNEAAKDGGRVFWSGEGALNNATNYAKSTGGTTLEMTRAGQNLQNLIATRNIPWIEARPMWQRLSTVYAKGAKGTVNFFPGTTVNPGSIWLNTERKILLQNGVKIVTHK